MNNSSSIRKLMCEIVGTDRQRISFRLMEVESVNGNLCDAKIGDLVIPNIRLSSTLDGTDKGIIITPAIGSVILVADLSNGELRELAVMGYSEVESVKINIGDSQLNITDNLIELNGGSNNGLVKIAELVKKLNNLENDINALKKAFSGWTPVYEAGLKTATTSWATQSLTATLQFDLEDTTITH